jgi:hypothetical protein
VPFVLLVFLESEFYLIIEEWQRDRNFRKYKRWQQSGKQPPARRNRNEDYEAYHAELWRQLFLVIYMGRTIRENVGYLWATGRKYWWHRDGRVSQVSRKLCRECGEAALWVDHLRAGLELRRQFRRLWVRDHSDLPEFWKLHFEATYTKLEETTKELASLLLEPELYEWVVRILAAHRCPLELPGIAAEAARNDLRQLKSTLWLMLPANRDRLNHPIFKSIVGWGPHNGKSPHIPLISAYARGIVNRLSAGERETEEKEIEELLAQLSCDHNSARSGSLSK